MTTGIRNVGGTVEDLWYQTKRNPDGTTSRIPTKLHGTGSQWRVRYIDDTGKERTKRFKRKVDARAFLDDTITALNTGRHIAPRDAKMRFSEWSDRWIAGYNRRESTVRQARVHLKTINATFGNKTLGAIRPDDVRAWTVQLKKQGLSDATIYATHSRLKQVLDDAHHEGLIPRNPCGRRTAPPMGSTKVYVATTDQVWALHDAFPDHLRSAVLLGAFSGLRIKEVCGLRVEDVDLDGGVVTPHFQYPAVPLKTKSSRQPVPIPDNMASLLRDSIKTWPGEWVVTDGAGGQVGDWHLQRVIRSARTAVEGLPEGFSFHDLRHFYASSLIAAGLSVKVVQACMRHDSAKVTLDTYGHLFPDADEPTRSAIGALIASRAGSPAG
ncbi:integrase [Dietzia cinnamea]|nr:integrase [Dietzia cinnamea]